MPGISDLSIFDLNVRLGLGKTKFNRELATTILSPKEHSLFPAYHNGLTLLTRKIERTEGEILLHGVSVVNGCQSLLALYNNRTAITPELRVLVKIVEIGNHTDLVEDITYRTNNQNPVNVHDQRSTDAIQRDLQEQVTNGYAPFLGYSIRQGELISAAAVLDNTLAAQLITAVYLSEQWNAVRKLGLFDQEYHRIFSRRIDGHKLFLLYQMNEAVDKHRTTLAPELESSFASARFTCLHLTATMLRLFSNGGNLLEEPQRWLPVKLADVCAALNEFAEEAAESLNFYVESQRDSALANGTTFDPKTIFKSKSGVLQLEREVATHVRYQLRRNADYGFNVPPAVTT